MYIFLNYFLKIIMKSFILLIQIYDLKKLFTRKILYVNVKLNASVVVGVC
jgi:hypothetical protein